jgi:hypothetical protein
MAGQGCKICPFADMFAMKKPHHLATRETIRTSREHERLSRLHENTPTRELLEKMASLWSSLMRLGCGDPPTETTCYSDDEKVEHKNWQSQIQAA